MFAVAILSAGNFDASADDGLGLGEGSNEPLTRRRMYVFY